MSPSGVEMRHTYATYRPPAETQRLDTYGPPVRAPSGYRDNVGWQPAPPRGSYANQIYMDQAEASLAVNNVKRDDRPNKTYVEHGDRSLDRDSGYPSSLERTRCV